MPSESILRWPLTLAAWSLAGTLCLGASDRPAVLFCGGVHAKYVAAPLVALGIEVDACKPAELDARLAGGKYNVVVIGTLHEPELAAVDRFLAHGGGVLACQPASYPDEKGWNATCQWLSGQGARPRWEVFKDDDAQNVVRDVMGCTLSQSNQILPPAADGVSGVLTYMAPSTTGCEPPMSFDLSPAWKPVVRGARSLHSVRELRHDVCLQPWLIREGQSEPALLALRELRQGRAAVLAIRYYWLFTPPSNCPTAEAMLTAGAGGRPSAWLRVCANTFRWLAEPSMRSGLGGCRTPPAIVNPPQTAWEIPATIDWSKSKFPSDRRQYPGLIGARTRLSSGRGSVADYARAARQCGLSFIVFLEDSLVMDQARWDRLAAECKAESSKEFAAVPGLTYEDAQGNHLYALADEVQLPKPTMLLPDRRLATTQPMRSRAYFDYVNEYLQQHAITGFWNHRANWLNVADYKLYNSFPIYSAIDGKPVDDALDDYLYWMDVGGCNAVLAFEIMTGPEQVARRAKDGWRVVSFRSPETLQGKWYQGAWSFSGMNSQYITRGPQILVWDAPNCLVGPNGLWWRPDLWEYRLRLRVASDAGLKSVTIYDGNRGVLRRWLPSGQKTFQEELVLTHCRQMAPTLVVEDADGRRAVSMAFYSRNLVKEEFICSDRCNFLGNSRLRSRDGQQTWTPAGFQANMGVTPSKGRLNVTISPAVSLTRNSPTLPIDGAPAGLPTCTLSLEPQIPGEYPHVFAYPQAYLIGPEIGIGQADYRLAYDPEEVGALQSPLGHPYVQPQDGSGNSWGSWHKLVPTCKTAGYLRTYACNWVPGEFRIGWQETDLTVKEAIELKTPLRVGYASQPGWRFYRGGQPITEPGKDFPSMPLPRGTFGLLEHSGGAVMVIPLDGDLEFRVSRRGDFDLHLASDKSRWLPGERIRYRIALAGAEGGTTAARMLEFAEKFGIARPGSAGYAAQITRGRQIDNYLCWRLAAEGGAVEAAVPKTDMPSLVPALIEGLNDNWSVQLLDKRRPWPNHRSLPIRDGVAYAELDFTEGPSELFLGHPVTADDPRLKLLASWQEPGTWYVEAHNPTDHAVKTVVRSAPGWTPFSLQAAIELSPGASRHWTLRAPSKGP